MNRSNPYDAIASAYLPLLHPSAAIPLAPLASASPSISLDAPKVLLFSPHPDDECLTGALPLRLLRELQCNVINVAVTLGSRQERRQERWQELKNACEYLRFGLVLSQEGGLEQINPETRQKKPASLATGSYGDRRPAQTPSTRDRLLSPQRAIATAPTSARIT
jgi:hypothetical protein